MRPILSQKRLINMSTLETSGQNRLSASTSTPQGQETTRMREVTLGQAIREALAEEMRRDPRVFIMGEDVAEAGTPFKVLSGLVDEFGTARVIDSPISEAGITGLGVGGAMTGMRPIIDIMFGDFIALAMDQIVNRRRRCIICPAASSRCRWSFVPPSV